MAISLFDIINKFTGNGIPPIMQGTKAIIRQLAEEERKLAELGKQNAGKTYSMIREKENISTIFEKYVNKDCSKDAYLFIKQ